MKKKGGLGISGNRMLAIAFASMATLTLMTVGSKNTAASFTSLSMNPVNVATTLVVQPPASQNNASSGAAGLVTVSWTATPTAPGTGHTLTYDVLRGPVGGPYSVIGSTAGLTLNDTPSSDGIYQYVVQAKVTGGGTFTSGNSAAKSGISDRTAPAISISCNAAACNGAWYNATVAVTESGTDGGTGMGSVTRNVDAAGQISTAGATVTFNVAGDSAGHTVVYFGTDAVGNAAASSSQTIRIDGTAPTAPGGISLAGGTATGSLNIASTSAGTDALSGVAGYRVYYVASGAPCPAAPYAASAYFAGNPPAMPMIVTGLISKQNYCAYVRTVDNAGNQSANSNVAGPVKAR